MVSSTISAPMSWAKRSIARPASFERKSPMASAAESAAPSLTSRPKSALSPSPHPATLPMLKARPPIATSSVSALPSPGSTRSASSCAGRRDATTTRQMVSCAPRSKSTERSTANPKLAPSWPVKTAVWVRNPGPMAEVAMRNAAPSSTRRRPRPTGGGAAAEEPGAEAMSGVLYPPMSPALWHPKRILVSHTLHEGLGEYILARRPDLEVRARGQREIAAEDVEWAEVYVGFWPPAVGPWRTLRWIHCIGAGVDAFAFRAGLSEETLLTRTAEDFGPMIGEYCLARALAVTQRLRHHEAEQRARSWRPKHPERLRGTRAVIVGTGAVGRGIARAFLG